MTIHNLEHTSHYLLHGEDTACGSSSKVALRKKRAATWVLLWLEKNPPKSPTNSIKSNGNVEPKGRAVYPIIRDDKEETLDALKRIRSRLGYTSPQDLTFSIRPHVMRYRLLSVVIVNLQEEPDMGIDFVTDAQANQWQR